jgi:hypothetical protein
MALDLFAGIPVSDFARALDWYERPMAATAARGIGPAERETYPNGVRKVTYRDPDGDEIGFGGAPLEEAE